MGGGAGEKEVGSRNIAADTAGCTVWLGEEVDTIIGAVDQVDVHGVVIGQVTCRGGG